ncbi:flagellar hook-associated protein 1 FlgK [Enterobacter sp. BIGb0383]|uniref:flagellar hook-associated protein FlgK n=1 Tax=unclassified Enterobacter TaxID=2608935 RepID=UPI000F4AC6D7|nr:MULTISPECIES: flagellar hook-associated protein FlgK [unclassified Enterobacter]ROP49392.1 flagellar hook-associated protein 1 FlgK [Enterobacter sp. BIGb0383]ROS00732.1 flagellar hook-associated protein 1 FlgK [Enterobacter sp. BIGb0359]
MSSLINSAMSGLSGAQAALNTASNNIASYNVAGYTRQTTLLGQSNNTLTSGGWIGNGVYVAGVQREYDSFITNQLRGAQTQSAGLTTQYEQMSKIDNILSGSTNTLSSTLQSFFSTLQTLAGNAEDPASRQSLLGQAEGLVNQFKVTDQYLRDQDKQVNLAVTSSVEQINTYSKQIASLNEQISRLTAVGGGASPNDLLDQRDQLVSNLNKIVGVDVSVQDGKNYNITMANGYTLVQGSTARQLAAVPSSADPTRTTVAYVDALAGNIEIPEKLITNGSLGGLLSFRSKDLDGARNSVNQLAMAFGSAFNAQHKQGIDADGADGTDFFKLGQPYSLNNTKNAGNAVLTPTIQTAKDVTASDYKVAFTGGTWQVTRLSDNAPVAANFDAGAGTLTFGGMEVSIAGTAAENDSFTVRPVSDTIINMELLIKDESKIALGVDDADNGASDNRNGQKLLDLQKDGTLVGGKKSFNDAYATLVSEVGNTTKSLKTTSTTQANVVTQLSNQQQSISGVNLDEEYGNLQRYQQYYLANAQVLQTANALFDAILGIR